MVVYSYQVYSEEGADDVIQSAMQENGPGGGVSANNQLSSRCYDAAGNLVLNASCPQPPGTPFTPTYSYDAENHLVYAGGVNYVYDGDGNRVMKSNGPIYWFTSGGGALDESDLSGNITNEYVFFNGQRIARRDPSGNAFYYFDDHLGTARSIAEVPAGQTTATLCYDADFYPFGGERWYTDSCDSHFKFTGKERDTESGLDNFGARYDASSMGRFMSPDDPLLYQDKADPQSLNLYSYVRGNPLNRVDPNGHLTIIVPGTDWKSNDWNQNMKLISDAKQAFHDDDVEILPWTGDLGGAAIDQGAQQLASIVNNHQFAPGEQLNIIGHSRGGDVALDATGKLNHKVDNLITLATPVYVNVPIDSSNIGTWINAYTEQDWVPGFVSTNSFTGIEDASTYFDSAHNLKLDAHGYGPVTAHTAIWKDDYLRQLWWRFWARNAGQDYWDPTTNTLYGHD